MSKILSQINTPKGFSFRVNARDRKHVAIQLFRSGNFIGRVTLYKRSTGVYETHSYLDDRYHGKGLGAIMYMRAIKWALEHKCSVRSSGASSDKARRVWEGKTIRKFFSIKKRKGEQKHWDVWYAYPKKR